MDSVISRLYNDFMPIVNVTWNNTDGMAR